jgi:5-oxoprolinase (ATP-hydrolysing)
MQSEQAHLSSILGVDIGGTFTDIVYFIPSLSENGASQLIVHKIPGTPKNPAQGLLTGMRDINVESNSIIVHGSTVATNALLERKGARAALITTEGFADVLEIGRQDRPALYDIMQQRPPALIPKERRLELPERLDYHGTVLLAPTPEDYDKLMQKLADCEPESVAISLLYSFLNPLHEKSLADLLRERFPNMFLSLSSDILPQFREYERTSTVAVNAYVQPIMSRYLQNLQEHVHGPLRIMQSSGGSISASVAALEPVRTVLSGPAGGVIGAYHIAKLASHEHIITIDMGGTSTDVALCAGSITETTEAFIAGCPIGVPTIAIHTVGAGGGSIVRLDDGNALKVGPDSAGADPGPACYGKGDTLTVTDANLVLGRIDPAYFLGGRFSLYPERAFERVEALAQNMGVSVQEAALGIIRVVNANMERAIRSVSLEKGHDPRFFTLLPFGGSGPLHACELAEALRIPKIFIPRYPGVLSALGMVLAPIVKDYVDTMMLDSHEVDVAFLGAAFTTLETRAQTDMRREISSSAAVINAKASNQFTDSEHISMFRTYDLRYFGQSYELMTPDAGNLTDTLSAFHVLHEQRYGHSHPEQPVQIVALRLKAVVYPGRPDLPQQPFDDTSPEHAYIKACSMIFTSGEHNVRVFDRAQLHHGNRILGPALLVQTDCTILLPPSWEGIVDAWGNIEASISAQNNQYNTVEIDQNVGSGLAPDPTLPDPIPPVLNTSISQPVSPVNQRDADSPVFDPVSLEIFKHLFASAAEEMGVTLGRTAYSPNIKERKDYSCACFDSSGRLIAQAAHIPVHLGAMPASVRAAIEHFPQFEPGDVILLNDPFLGGTHLPDITMVSPVFITDDPDGLTGELFGFVASRAHHADIGGMSPGSMPMSRELYQEGIIIPPIKLAKKGVVNQEILDLFYRNVRTPWERRGDIDAQMAAARVGERRLHEIIARYGSRSALAHAEALLAYSAQLTRVALMQLPDHEVSFIDYLDDDGWGVISLPIAVHIKVEHGNLQVNFTGSASQSAGCINAVRAVTHSAVLYAVRCLVGEHVPTNQGCLEPVSIYLPEASLLNPVIQRTENEAQPSAAVAAGNVETSQRVVDVLFGALSQLAPDRIPAASQGTMNNLTLGGYDTERGRVFAYYETMGGGMGARNGSDGLSGVHVHMSNTRNTPIEAMEMELPLRVRRYSLRHGSGGDGRFRGGDGICRELIFLAPATVTLLTERRRRAPYGLHGGEPGAVGKNSLEHNGSVTPLPGKVTFDASVADVLSICTPGGGGFLSSMKEN